MSRKKYLTRTVVGGTIFFLISTVIFAFFFSLARGHMLTVADVVPWLAGGIVAGAMTYFWARNHAKEFRERANLWEPDSPQR